NRPGFRHSCSIGKFVYNRCRVGYHPERLKISWAETGKGRSASRKELKMGLFKKKVKESFQPNYTDKLPLVPFKILETDIPIYSDPECKQQVPEGRILILLGLGPDEKVVEEE